MPRDKIYQKPRSPVSPFEFDDQVAGVFDDMLRRSIPLYDEIIRRQVRLIARRYQPGTLIYDLGCSNGNLGMAVCRRMGAGAFRMKGVDTSAPMLKSYAERLAAVPHADRIELHQADIIEVPIHEASVVVLNFTLQFLPPDRRDTMVRRIYDGMVPGGILLFCEKIANDNPRLARLQQDVYYEFKKENGYSDLEISQKREALEKVLVPESLARHRRRLADTGFHDIDVWLKWFNFAALLAFKPERS